MPASRDAVWLTCGVGCSGASGRVPRVDGASAQRIRPLPLTIHGNIAWWTRQPAVSRQVISSRRHLNAPQATCGVGRAREGRRAGSACRARRGGQKLAFARHGHKEHARAGRWSRPSHNSPVVRSGFARAFYAQRRRPHSSPVESSGPDLYLRHTKQRQTAVLVRFGDAEPTGAACGECV